jgi:tetratricopeptide (TPR) repeat protein
MTGKKGAVQAADADADLKELTEAVQALHRKSWSKAAKLFASLAEKADLPEVRARARQYLAACRQQEAKAVPAAGGESADPYLSAVFEKNRGGLAAALAIVRRGGRDQKDERFAYLAASIHALEGKEEEAAKALSRAVELSPKNRVHAFHDPDFAELRRNPSFRHLFGLP